MSETARLDVKGCQLCDSIRLHWSLPATKREYCFMMVPSWQFALFATAGAVLFNLSAALWWRSTIWLVLNLYFLSTFAPDPISVVPLAGFLLLGYLGATVGRGGGRWATPFFAVLTLAVFVWLKRYSFVPPSTRLPIVYTTIGLSYIFFRVMHLVIDAGQPGAERVGPISYINYTLNFTSLVSGPIQRYDEYRRMEERERLPLTELDLGWAVWRMVLGAFKVMIVSTALRAAQHHEMAALPAVQPWVLRLGEGALIAVIYPIFLYANFSGYTDFVIGAARLFRLRLPENFDRPFSSVNFIEFWNRWHITLSHWLKSYVFSPLLLHLMRKSPSRELHPYLGVLALLATFFLVGAWHGQTTEFLFFGLLQGGGVAGNRLYQLVMTSRLTPKGYRKLCANALYRALARGLTFTWFTFTLLWFWSSWHELAGFVSLMGGGAAALIWPVVIVAATFVLALLEAVRAALLSVELSDAPLVTSRYARTAFVSAMCLILVVTGAVLNMTAPDIVYKGF
jgi:alginate O-acetyltransferase complex protein AlgI